MNNIVKQAALLAKRASGQIANAEAAQKDKALLMAADALWENQAKIIAANKIDLERARKKNLSSAMMDRLVLDEVRIKSMIAAIKEIASMKDPVGVLLDSWERPNGLLISRVTVPLGARNSALFSFNASLTQDQPTSGNSGSD